MGFISDVFSGIEKLLVGSINGIADGVGKAPSNDIQPGDIELMAITLLSEDQQRQYNLLAQCTSIDIYESATSPVIFAELGIADSIGLHQSFPIIGEEYVSIMFRTPSSDTPAQYLFRVNQVKDKKITENNKMVTYTLQLVSAELIRNAARLVTLTYEDTIDNIVKRIMNENLETEKPVSVDSTSGIEKGNITRMSPFVAIDFLRRRAVSAVYSSSSYVFFESRDGYRFTTFEKMMDDGGKGIQAGSDKQFFFDTNRKDNIKDVTMRNILAYNQITFNDTISKVQHGGITNEVNAFDIVTGGIRKVTYTNNIGQDNFKTADQNAASTNSSNFNRLHGKTTAVRKFVPISSDKPNTQRPERIAIAAAYAQTITQNIVQIHIYGDSEIRVGDVITCTFPAAISADDTQSVARLDSGSYLVTKVRHMILNTDRPQHTISLELIKGNFVENS